MADSPARSFTLASLCRDALSLYKSNLNLLLILSLIAIVPGYIESFASVFGVSTGMFSMPLGLAATVAGLWAMAALIFTVNERASGGELTLGQAFEKTGRRILPFFLVVSLSFLIVACGFLFFIVPGVIFGVWFYLSTIVAVLEESGILGALKRSRELIRGHFLFVLGVSSLLFFIYTLISLPYFSDMDSALLLIIHVWSVVFFMPFSTGIAVVLYRALAAEKGTVAEAKGLQAGAGCLSIIGLTVLLFVLSIVWLTAAAGFLRSEAGQGLYYMAADAFSAEIETKTGVSVERPEGYMTIEVPTDDGHRFYQLFHYVQGVGIVFAETPLFKLNVQGAPDLHSDQFFERYRLAVPHIYLPDQAVAAAPFNLRANGRDWVVRTYMPKDSSVAEKHGYAVALSLQGDMLLCLAVSDRQDRLLDALPGYLELVLH